MSLNFSECLTYLKSAFDKEKEEYKIALSLAWKTALWSRCNAKEFPKIEDLLNEVDKNIEKATTKETKIDSAKRMFEMAKQLNARFGGN